MASSSTSNPYSKIDIPYPSHNFANQNIVTVKLSGRDVYHVWVEQMLCLLTSHDMLGFIDGRFPSPFDGRNDKAKEEDMKAWIISDSLVKGWILGSLSEKVAIVVVNRLASKHEIISANTFYHKKPYFSAKDAWDELKLIYGPSVPQQTKEANSMPEDAKSEDEADRERLCRFILQGKTEKVDDIFRKLELTPTDIITSDGNTSLHVAVSTKNQELLVKLLGMIRPEENSELLNVQNSYGSTPLHVAVIVGNIDAVDVLVQRNPRLLFAKDNKGHTPLAISLYNMHTEISRRLLEHIQMEYIEKYEENHTKFSGTSDDELLVLAISSKDFSLSLKLVRLYETIHDSEAVLMAIAQNFPCELSFWGKRIQAWEAKHRGLVRSCGPSGAEWKYLISVYPFLERLQTHRDAINLLSEVFRKIPKNSDSSPPSLPQYYTNPVFEATKLNASEVVILIVREFPDAIWSVNKDGLNFIQYAVINRSEKIYSLLYKMSEHRNIYKTIKDPYGNNLLHLAGRLAPADKLNLISGAALQLQLELQWFKEVEEFVGPITRMEKNYAGETPEMVFTREHEDLVSKGGQWMKETAEFYMIATTVIVTIAFTAAITAPGGNNQDTGIPIHNNNIAFKVFGASVAISLFAAVTSFLMFLSIFTSRFSAEDFLLKLPRSLIIGLAALNISTSAMIIAFGATLFLEFGHDNSWILIPIGLLTCHPITSFVTLQFPLIVDLLDATYGRSIFDRSKPDVYFY